MSPESNGPTLPDWSEKHPCLRGKWEWFYSHTLTERGGQAGFRVYTDKKRRFKGEKYAFEDTQLESPISKLDLKKEQENHHASTFQLEMKCIQVNNKKKKHDKWFLIQRIALIENSHTHFRMWYLTDQSTPAGLSLCLGCGLLATGPCSYRNAMGRGGSAKVREGRALHQYCFYHITSTTEQLQCASAHKDATIICAAHLCALQWN